jgi:hypothetical protein
MWSYGESQGLLAAGQGLFVRTPELTGGSFK